MHDARKSIRLPLMRILFAALCVATVSISALEPVLLHRDAAAISYFDGTTRRKGDPNTPEGGPGAPAPNPMRNNQPVTFARTRGDVAVAWWTVVLETTRLTFPGLRGF